MSSPASQATPAAAPFWRRLAAMTYDSLIVIALMMFATALVLPLNQGEALEPGKLWFQLYLFVISVGFFLAFWRRGGQTLGMRAWKIKLVHDDHTKRLEWRQLIIRLFTALLGLLLGGLGFLWALIDREKLTLHDRASHSRVIMNVEG